MRERDYYPAGAYSDQNAPYNEPVIPERDFEIDVQFTLHKVVDVTTDKYTPEYDEESGHTYANTENTEWSEVYDESGHFTILEMLDELKVYVEQDLAMTGKNTGKGRHLQRLLESCQGWELIDSYFCEQ